MTQYYAASFSVSQGTFDTKVTCYLISADDKQETSMSIEWPVMPPQTDPENAGEWLFHVLEDLVTNFDSHQVTSAETGPRKPLQERLHGK